MVFVKWWEQPIEVKEDSVKSMIPHAIPLRKRSKITLEQRQAIEDAFKLDATVEEACMLWGISVPTYYQYINSDEELKLRMNRARQFPDLIAKACVMKNIQRGDAKTALRYLELTNKKYRWEPELWEVESAPVVQFISVAAENKWENTTTNDTQNSIRQNSVSIWLWDSWMSYEWENESQTPWENEEEALRRLDSANFSNGYD